MVQRVQIREGYPFAFTVLFEDGIDARYTSAVFQVRERADTSLPLVVGCDQDSGISIDYGTGVVSVSVGATHTDDLQVSDRSKPMVGELRLSDPSNADDRIGGQFPVFIVPEVADSE